MTHDPLTVACIDCLAPPGQPCRSSNPDTLHASRAEAARWAAAEPGSCALCGRQMYRFTDPDDAYHLDGVAPDCPPLPDPETQWNAYAARTSGTGISPGHPGPEHWRPAPDVRLALVQAEQPASSQVTGDVRGTP